MSPADTPIHTLLIDADLERLRRAWLRTCTALGAHLATHPMARRVADCAECIELTADDDVAFLAYEGAARE